MSKHTPGPWYYHNGAVDAQTNLPLCYNHAPRDGRDSVCHLTGYFSDHMDGNGMLIAAAPDLLAALEGMMKCFDDGVGEHWNADELDAARAAIAKARGEA